MIFYFEQHVAMQIPTPSSSEELLITGNLGSIAADQHEVAEIQQDNAQKEELTCDHTTCIGDHRKMPPKEEPKG